ncbi:MAG: hypothetical protein DI587_17090 [Variovorax paradoxus]|nr:MAG: hypothetical protein DI583_17090 [Variovorax paradoxus]PZQ08950.1 MAG: hypothetical protein DI587_17090 [Variovorax paradoxus]
MQRKHIVAGDTLRFAVALPEYPASAGWQLFYRLVPQDAGQAAIDLLAVGQGDEHLLDAPAAVTAGWVQGAYAWSSWVVRNGETYSVAQGLVAVQPNPRTLNAGHDARTPARKALDAADQALATYGNKAWTQSYSINGRSMTFTSSEKFMAWRSLLRSEVQREEAAAGLGGPGNRRKVFVRLPRA